MGERGRGYRGTGKGINAGGRLKLGVQLLDYFVRVRVEEVMASAKNKGIFNGGGLSKVTKKKLRKR